MDADRPTLRALLWCFAAALQCLAREQPLPAHCASPKAPTVGATKHHRNAESQFITLKEY